MNAQVLSLVTPRHPRARQDEGAPLGEILIRRGGIDAATLDWALEHQRKTGAPLGRILIAHGHLDESALVDALAEQFGAGRIVPGDLRAAPEAIDRLGIVECARMRLVPLMRQGAAMPVATSEPHRFAARRAWLEDLFGPVAMTVATEAEIDGLLTAMRRNALVGRAESRVAAEASCRDMGRPALSPRLAALAVAAAGVVAIWPGATLLALTLLALAVAAVNTGLVLTALLMRQTQGSPASRPIPLRMPKVSILVPLHGERDIAGTLVQRLSRLDYPRDLLDICLVIESADRVTRQTLRETVLPPWMRVVAVADGAVTTKPRAMNYALDFCDGAIVGIYDAEDCPEPDQLLKVVSQFAASPAQVACLQGRLNFYNSRASWIARCFALDYSTWFGMVLPALHRLGWPVPLGGTTVFFRREALDALGAWDAHNVTEDADLGMRLARRGYRTDLLDSTTMEEATTRPVPWMRQRSRWLKGYAMTWLVHMRDPRRLWRDVGAWRFIGIQVLFLGSLLGTLLAPALWLLWLLILGLPHPLGDMLPAGGGLALVLYLNATALIVLAAHMRAAWLAGHRHLIAWAPAMHLYFPMATFALAKGLWELAVCPFFWDKTAHGVSQPDAPVTPRGRGPHPA
ncbi:glycosyl transferase, group 2 family protein [Oceaniovalibus guishaninsula JLT2003]|uniref:Glycosyl transferase, group 2 family protein n=1 Tax=Oceaniovalibus guishaninsula JLT2003 TaxID=1231392 RepID=K2HRB7_9RHOB|nr:glycosyltransferase [Oceaniovalibus guishaninsula]EKE45304.1 glycosyl transferase, group 2 family protein [Oceaniovalibus guishaninsula JLT2003]